MNPLENFKSVDSDGSYGVSKNVFSAAVNGTLALLNSFIAKRLFIV
jgi:hypothetical protein